MLAASSDIELRGPHLCVAMGPRVGELRTLKLLLTPINEVGKLELVQRGEYVRGLYRLLIIKHGPVVGTATICMSTVVVLVKKLWRLVRQ